MAMLTASVADIIAEGHRISGEVTGADIDLAESDECLSGPLTVFLDVTKLDGTLAVSGTVEGKVRRECVRCLRPYDDPLSVVIQAGYVRQGSSEGRAEPAPRREGRTSGGTRDRAVDEEGEDEIYVFQGEQLDLAPMIREQVILAAPLQPLCKDDCRGLCPQCGQDLNVQQCRCSSVVQGSAVRVVRSLPSSGNGEASPT